MKFAPKLTVLFISICAIFAAVVFTIAYFQVEKILEGDVRARMENRVFFAMDTMDHFLYERLSDISVISHDPVISSGDATAEEITERLIFFRNAYKCYISLSFFNLDRIRIADTAGLRIGEQHPMTRYWEDVLAGKVSAASDVRIAKDLQVPIAYFASAVNNKEGRAIGVVVARIPTSRLFEMIKGFAGIQEEEEIDIVNKDGLLIYSNHNREGILKENLPGRESIKIAQRDKIFGSVKRWNPDEKETMLQAFCREQGYLDFKGNDWIILFNVPTRVIFGPVTKLLKMLIIMFLVILPVLALVIYLFSKDVSLPLARLSFAAGEIGKGKLDTVIEVKSKDEFGSLANTFNQMATDLKKTTISIDDLNKEIAERKRAQVKLQQHIKHLNCLYGLSRLAVQPQISLDQIFQETTGLIRSTYRYPDITCVRITFNGIQYKTDNFQKTEHSQWGDILVRGEKAGSIEVYCLQERQENGEGSFLKEEGTLLNAVCEKLGRIAELKQATDKLRLFRTLIDQSNDCIFILEPKWGRFLDVNERACQSLGYSRKELLEMSFKDIEEFPEGLSWQQQIEELKLKGDIIIQGRHKCKDGTRFFAETSLNFVKEEKEDYIIAIARDITERKQMEEALIANKEQIQKQNEFLNSILESLTHPFYVIDANNYTIKMSNQAAQAERLYEKATCYESTHGRDAPCDGTERPCPVAIIIETKKPAMVEHVHLDKDGNLRNVEVHGYPIFDTNGAVSQVILYSLDITDRKRAEEEIKNLKQQIEFILGATNTGLDIIDSQFNIQYIDPAWQKVYGDPMGRKCYEYFMGRNEVCPGCGIVKALETKSIAVTEEVLPRENNRPIQVTTRPFQNDKGKWLVAEVNVDITERKQMEEKLRASENKYKTLLENLRQNIFYKDKNSVYVSCNENYAHDLGIKPEEIAGKTDYDFYPKDLAEKYRADDKRIMESGKSEDIEEKYTQDGQETVVYTVKTPVKDQHDNVTGVLGIFWDITERKRAEQRQAELLKEVESVNRELKDFAYVVSHDLKAPLRGIKTLAGWLSADYRDKFDEQGKEQIRLLSGRVDRMNNLINGILEYSRVGRIQEKQSFVDLNKLVPEIIDMIAPPENITITVENELPVIECEPTRTMQVFQNLLSNAVKYMDKPQGLIKVGCIEENGFWKFSVADNGPGIEERFFEKIFQIFQTLAPRDSVESTGIGLTVAKKIVELYGGRIWVESKVGEGSTFFFTLPKQKIEVKNAELEAHITC